MPERKRILEEAAESAHLSVSALVLQAAETRADEILLERQLVRLAPQAAEALTACKRTVEPGQGAGEPGILVVDPGAQH